MDRFTTRKYVLDDKRRPVPEPDVITWANWMETSERIVAQETIDGVEVSTIFLGLDHNFTGVGPPIIWETCVFKPGPRPRATIEMKRCAGSWEQAEAMHREVVEWVKWTA